MVEVRDAFDDVEDIDAVPTPFTAASDDHPLAPIAGLVQPVTSSGLQAALNHYDRAIERLKARDWGTSAWTRCDPSLPEEELSQHSSGR
jgi:hypothetical protein